MDDEGGGGAPPGLEDGPFIAGDSFLKFTGPLGERPGGLKAAAGPFGPPPTLNLAPPLFGNLGIPPANNPPRPTGAPPPTGPSSCEPLHWLGISEWALLVRPATVANFPGPGGGGPPPIGPAGFLPPINGELLSLVSTFFNFAPLKLFI